MLDTIHQTSMKILGQTGIRIDDEKILGLLAAKGVKQNGNIAYFTEVQIRKALSTVPKEFILHGRNPKFAPCIGGDKTHYLGSFGAPYIIQEGVRRDAVLDDYIKLAKLVHSIDEMPINGGILVQPVDIPADKFHLILLYAAILFSDKALVGMSGNADQQEEIMGLLKIPYGQKTIKSRPVIITVGNTTSPLILDGNLLQTLYASAQYHQPMIISPGPMAGSTGPIDMAGNISLANAEILATIACSQAISPGTPVVYGLMAHPADMKTCEVDTGSPGAVLGTVMCARLARHYGLPSRGGTVPNAKDMSVLSGLESMMKNMAASTAGIDLIIHSVGLIDRINCVSLEQFIIDVDIIRRVEYFKHFFTQNPAKQLEEICFPEIQKVGQGGDFLTAMSTVQNCRKTPFSSHVSCHETTESLSENDAIKLQAKARVDQILDVYTPPELEAEIHGKMRKYLLDFGVPEKYVDHIDLEYARCREGQAGD